MDPALGGKKEKSSATVEKRQKSLIITPQIAANCHSPAEGMEGETLAWNTQTRKKEAKGGTTDLYNTLNSGSVVLKMAPMNVVAAIFTEEFCALLAAIFKWCWYRIRVMNVDMFGEKNSNIKIMPKKLNNGRIMCNHLK